MMGGEVDVVRRVLRPAIVVFNLMGLYVAANDILNVAFGTFGMVWVSNSLPEDLNVGRPERVLGMAFAAIGVALNLSLPWV